MSGSLLKRLPGFLFLLCLVCATVVERAAAQPIPQVEAPGFSIRKLGDAARPAGVGPNPVRLAKDPRNNHLYILHGNGGIYHLQVNPGTNTSVTTLVYSAADHGQNSTAGMVIGQDGTFYVVGNQLNGNFTRATIMKGVLDSSGSNRVWSAVARTENYPVSKTPYDHAFNGIILSPDGASLYLNSGSRTDHGEIQATGGAFPNLREAGLTACILRIPANSEDLLLRNDREALRTAGYIFAEGIRNTYDFRFSPSGELFGPENGPERDMSDELNWLREGRHYGFPWRMGGEDNPQQFPNYDPGQDKLLDVRFLVDGHGFYQNDPAFPPSPGGFTEPIVNVGPDADRYRSADGQIHDASSLGQTMSTFTAHRSPLGLVFDETMTLHPDYRGDAFMMSWSYGDPNGTAYKGPFHDAAADLLHLKLTKVGDNYQVQARRVVGGFGNMIDAEIIGNKIYAIDYTLYWIWEVTVPEAPPTSATLGAPKWSAVSGFSFMLTNNSGGNVMLESSTNLLDWIGLTNFANGASLEYADLDSTNYVQRYYRVLPKP